MLCCRINITLLSKVLHKINNQLKIILEKKIKKRVKTKATRISNFYCSVT